MKTILKKGGRKPKPPLYTLPHGIEVIGEYAPSGLNIYWRVRIRPHRFFPDGKVRCGGLDVRRNRAVLAAKLGRPLTRQEIAHHEDECKSNDAGQNIVALTAAEHNAHHKSGQKHSEESKLKISNSLRKAYADGKRTSSLHHDQHGEKNPYAKLTWADVTAIRESQESNASLARQFSVSARNIRLIKQGSTWK